MFDGSDTLQVPVHDKWTDVMDDSASTFSTSTFFSSASVTDGADVLQRHDQDDGGFLSMDSMDDFDDEAIPATVLGGSTPAIGQAVLEAMYDSETVRLTGLTPSDIQQELPMNFAASPSLGFDDQASYDASNDASFDTAHEEPHKASSTGGNGQGSSLRQVETSPADEAEKVEGNVSDEGNGPSVTAFGGSTEGSVPLVSDLHVPPKLTIDTSFAANDTEPNANIDTVTVAVPNGVQVVPPATGTSHSQPESQNQKDKADDSALAVVSDVASNTEQKDKDLPTPPSDPEQASKPSQAGADESKVEDRKANDTSVPGSTSSITDPVTPIEKHTGVTSKDGDKSDDPNTTTDIAPPKPSNEQLKVPPATTSKSRRKKKAKGTSTPATVSSVTPISAKPSGEFEHADEQGHSKADEVGQPTHQDTEARSETVGGGDAGSLSVSSDPLAGGSVTSDIEVVSPTAVQQPNNLDTKPKDVKNGLSPSSKSPVATASATVPLGGSIDSVSASTPQQLDTLD
ncbi:hypothetical protein L218DRAFT_514043 [Marasmius fiardii PR-910]|nr:hypothetical protein L218DRAFT_514043 [Marasmius fiardii PR-910]